MYKSSLFRQGHLHLLQVVDVHQGEDDAILGAVFAAVGQQPHQVGNVGSYVGDFLLDRVSRGNHLLQARHQIGNIQTVGELGQGPAGIGGAQVKQMGGGGGKATHVELAIQKNHPDIGTFEQVVDVGVEVGELGNARLVLSVKGMQLFVEGLQLFVGALQFFVGGQQLFVGGLVLFVDDFQNQRRWSADARGSAAARLPDRRCGGRLRVSRSKGSSGVAGAMDAVGASSGVTSSIKTMMVSLNAPDSVARVHPQCGLAARGQGFIQGNVGKNYRSPVATNAVQGRTQGQAQGQGHHFGEGQGSLLLGESSVSGPCS